MKNPYPWQVPQWTHLMKLKRQQRLPHGLLFTGVAGMGKYHMAQCLQASLLCQATESPCGHCSSCHWLLQGYHPDAFELTPEETGKAIKVDSVRQWMEQFHQSAHVEEGYRIAVIHPAHALNAAAANSLLKTLEEPPNKRLIILITERPSQLPATVRSRCQAINFYTKEVTLVETWLKEQLGESAEGFLSLAKGAPLQALHYVQEKEIDFRQNLVNDLLAVQGAEASPVLLAEEWHKLPQQRLTEALQPIIWDVIRLKGSQQSKISDVIDSQSLQRLGQPLSWEQLFKISDHLLEKMYWRSKITGLNDQLLWESFLIQWCCL